MQESRERMFKRGRNVLSCKNEGKQIGNGARIGTDGGQMFVTTSGAERYRRDGGRGVKGRRREVRKDNQQ